MRGRAFALLICSCVGGGFLGEPAGSLRAADCQSAPSGLVAWWTGDADGTDLVGTNRGTLMGTALAGSSGLVLGGFLFDGTNSYVQIPDSPTLRPTNLTIEAWVRFSSLDSPGTTSPGQQYVVFKQNTRSGNFEGFEVGKDRVAGRDLLVFRVSSAAGQIAEAFSLSNVVVGTWYHVAGVRGPDFLRLYVNGMLQQQVSVTFPQNYGGFPMYLGSSGQAFWDRKLSGSLDEVSLYDRALSAGEIASLFTAGASGKCKRVVIAQSPANQAAGIGGSAVFGVSATGFGRLGYQWRFGGSPIAGATNSLLSLSNLQPAQAGPYDVVVTNAFSAATSAVAVLTVYQPPTISAQPQSRTNLVGTSATFSATASGVPPPALQWSFNGTPLPGATNSTLLIPNVQLADAGVYVLVATNAGGSNASSPALLTVWQPPSFTLQPASRTNIVGTSASFSATAAGIPDVLYGWEFNGSMLPGETNSSLVINNVQLPNAGVYRSFATNLAGASFSAPAALTVWQPPAFTLQPSSRTNIAGSTATFATGASGIPDVVYAWEFNGTVMAGETNSTLVLANVQVQNSGAYRARATNAAGAAVSAPAALTVWQPPSFTVQPASRTNIVGTPASFSATAAGIPDVAYAWEFNGNVLPGETNSTLTVQSVQLQSSGLYRASATNLAGAALSAPAALTVWQRPAITQQPASRTNVVSTDAAFQVLASGVPAVAYQWRFLGVPIPGATQSLYIRTGVTTADAGSYSVVVSNPAGSVTSQVALLTVHVPPLIVVPPQSLTLNQDETAIFSAIVEGTVPISYQWRFNGAKIAGASASTYLRPAVQAPDEGLYDVVVTNVAGSVTSSPALLSVNRRPSILTQPQDVTANQDESASFSAVCDGTLPLAYQWFFNGGAIAGATLSSYNRLNVQPSDAGSFTVRVTNVAGSVVSQPALLTVIPALPYVIVPPASMTIAVGSNATVGVFAGGGTPLSYQWRKNGVGLPGRTSSTLFLAAATVADSGDYDVVVSNSRSSVTSVPPATVTVVAPPSLVLQPVSRTDRAGTSASFGVVVSGQNLSYRWFKNQSIPLQDNQNVSGSRGPALLLQNIQAADQGSYSVVISNLAGAISSSGAQLSVIDPAISEQPQDVVATVSTAATLKCRAAGTPLLSYQWRLNDSDLVDGPRVSGARSSTLTIQAIEPSDAGNYTVRVSNSYGSELSRAAALEIVPHLVIPDLSLSNALRCALGIGSGVPIAASNMSNLKCLAAENRGITNLSGLEHAVNLERLILNRNVLSDLTPLRNLTSLHTLELENNAVEDLASLAQLTNLSCVNISGNGITNYGLLWETRGLTNLQARQSGLMKISGLAKATQLRSLVLSQNAIEDLEPLRGLTNLNYLDLRWNSIANVNALAGLPNLTQLLLGGNLLTNVTDIGKLHRLNLLNLEDNLVSSVNAIATLTNLSYLALSRNPATNLQVLASLKALTGIELRRMGLTNAEFLAALPALRYADLAFNNLRDLRSLVGRTNFNLVLDNNPAVDYSSVAALTNLAGLWLNENNFTDASFLTNLTRLKALAVDANRITSLQPLTRLAATLEHLSVSKNPVQDWSVLGSLGLLTEFRADGNQIGDGAAEVLLGLGKLRFLSLNDNRLSSAEPIRGLAGLRDLYLQQNRLEAIDALTNLAAAARIELGMNRLFDPNDENRLAASAARIVESLRCQRASRASCGCGASTNLTDAWLCQGVAVGDWPQHGSASIAVHTSICSPAGPGVCRPVYYISANRISSLTYALRYDRDPLDPLPVGVVSSNPAVVPASTVTVGASTEVGQGQLIIVPATNAVGTAVLTLAVTNRGGLVSTADVEIRVIAEAPLNCAGGSLDPILEASLRYAANRPSGDLAGADLLNLTEFQTAGSWVDFCGWRWLTNLVHLELDGAGETNLTLLTNLTSLASLRLEQDGWMDLSVLNGLPGLTNLVLRGDALTNQSALSAIPMLRTLSMDFVQIGDFSFVSGLTSLTGLSLRGNEITNIGFVLPLTNLEALDLTFNRVRDLTPLTALEKLRTVRVGQNYLDNISAMTALQQLVYADVTLNLIDPAPGSAGDSAVNALRQRSVYVNYLPQRSPPAFDVRTNWVINTSGLSSTRFSVQHNLRTDELRVFGAPVGPGVIAGSSLTRGTYPYWTLGVAPAPVASGATSYALTAVDDAGLRSTTNIQITLVPFQDVDDGVETPGGPWTGAGDQPWFGQNLVSHDGLGAAQSGTVGDDQRSVLETAVLGPGRLSFWWKVSSETNFDYVRFIANGQLLASNSGYVDWQKLSFDLPPGTNRLAWEYGKDQNTSFGWDAAWLDEVQLISERLEALPQPGVPYSILLILHGVIGNAYNLETSTNLLAWELELSMVLTNASMVLVVNDATEPRRFYRLARGQPIEPAGPAADRAFPARLFGRSKRTYDAFVLDAVLEEQLQGIPRVSTSEAVWTDEDPGLLHRYYRVPADNPGQP